jgi:hypothetical protein
MADKIKMNTDSVAKFRNLVTEISKMIKDRNNDMFYLTENFNQVSESMFIINDRMYQAVKVGNEVINMLNQMAYDVERARIAFINADNQGSTLFRGDDSSSTSSKNGCNGINDDNYNNAGNTPFDIFLGSVYTAGAVSAADKLIGMDVEKTWGTGAKISPNELVANLKTQGKNHDFRRGLIRDISKDARDLEMDVPKIPALAKGLGIATVAFTALAVADDFKNNKTMAQKLESSGIDVAMTGGAYVAATAAVGLVGGAANVVAAPEIAVGIVSVGVVVGIGALANIGANKIKSAWHLW